MIDLGMKDKVAIITGAASGVGKATAELFHSLGSKVVIADYNEEGAQELADKLNNEEAGTALAVGVDVSNEEQIINMIEKTIEEFTTLDILVNNAGVMDSFEAVGDITNEKWDRVQAVNVKGPMMATREAINRVFLEKGKGIIVNVASIGGVGGARAGAAYTASKHALIGLTKNTGFMYAEKGIRCNVVAPAGIETNIADSIGEVSQFGASRMMAGEKLTVRSATADEIARDILYLASNLSSNVNGAVVVSDSGLTAY